MGGSSILMSISCSYHITAKKLAHAAIDLPRQAHYTIKNKIERQQGTIIVDEVHIKVNLRLVIQIFLLPQNQGGGTHT